MINNSKIWTRFFLILTLCVTFLGANLAFSADSLNVADENQSDKNVENVLSDFNLSDSVSVEDVAKNWENSFDDLIESFGITNKKEAKIQISFLLFFVLGLIIFLAHIASRFGKKLLAKSASSLHLKTERISFYLNALFVLVGLFCLFGFSVVIAITWNIDVETFVKNEFVQLLISNVLSIYLITLLGLLTADILNGLIEKAFKVWGGKHTSRSGTLLPVARNTVYTLVAIVFVLILLSELGIDIMPLLAGAGVLGFAVGFGAQTLIKDLLTGFIIIFEDLVQVGDVVTLAGKTGLVEKITIRKIQLRALDGVVYTVPFSEITIVENHTKVFSYAMFNIGIAYRENVNEVFEILRSIDSSLQSDNDYKDVILEKLEIFGLDEFADSAVVIKARIKTKPSEQWRVMREFNLRLKTEFDKQGVEIPFPHQTLYFGEDKEGTAPSLKVKDIDK